ncbi:hypothetical protein GK108_30370 [Spirosoma terrae]|uniref:Uncharacterized protein n=2 Tax=Spirosoma terrae TaxID=1968276 RepID=A0A6L9LJS5_9BACT|nr:hypothetical protein [Spirosoma terrae]
MPHFAGKIGIVLKSIWDEILGSEFTYVKSLEPKIAKEFIKNKLLEIERIRVVPSNLSPLRDACLTKEQKNCELLKNYFDDIDNNSEIDVLVNVILKSLKKVQGFGIHMPTNEKARTKFTAEFIQNFVAKDESGYGFSETLKTMGEIDILIEKIDGNSVAICEGFNLKNSLNKRVIKNHINKLFTYDVNGLKANFIIVYVETQNLQIFWEKYYTIIQTIVTPYNLIEIIQLSDTWPSLPTDIKLCKLTYLRNGLKIFVYHMFVHMR